MNSIKRIFTAFLGIAATASSVATAAEKQIVRTGIEVLESRGFEGLVGKNVGLVTNPSGVDHNLRSTIDILHEAQGVNLKTLFAPEHVYAGMPTPALMWRISRTPRQKSLYIQSMAPTASRARRCLRGWTLSSMTSRTSAAVPTHSSARLDW